MEGVEFVEEIGGVGEVDGGLPVFLLESVAFKAFPSDEVFELSAKNARVEDLLDGPFLFVFDDDRVGRRLSTSRDVILRSWFQKGDMENGVK